MSLRTRLERLERRLGLEAGCPACRERRGQTVLLTASERPDGTVVIEEDEPQPCASCGQIPEQVVAVIEVIVEARTESL